MEAVAPRPVTAARSPTALLVAAFLSFLAANVIHNRIGLDPAIAPAALFTGLYLWKARRWMLLAATFFIAVPSLLFFRPVALADTGNALYFFNHVALLLGALLAVAAAVQGWRRS